jgi:uncharacterized protein YqgC (DUF456 family)
VTNPPNDLSPTAIAVHWVSRIMAVALIMVVPGVAGQWLDEKWGTGFLAPLGFVFGLVAGIYQLLVITGAVKVESKSNSSEQANNEP